MKSRDYSAVDRNRFHNDRWDRGPRLPRSRAGSWCQERPDRWNRDRALLESLSALRHSTARRPWPSSSQSMSAASTVLSNATITLPLVCASNTGTKLTCSWDKARSFNLKTKGLSDADTTIIHDFWRTLTPHSFPRSGNDVVGAISRACLVSIRCIDYHRHADTVS